MTPLASHPDYLEAPIATICAPLSASCPPMWSRHASMARGGADPGDRKQISYGGIIAKLNRKIGRKRGRK